MSTSMVQMNVRLPSQTKTAADDALAQAGVTPTEFVRMAWDKLARGGEERRRVEDAVLGTRSPEADASVVAALSRARSLYADYMERLGIDPDAHAIGFPKETDDREAYVEVLRERMSERGTP